MSTKTGLLKKINPSEKALTPSFFHCVVGVFCLFCFFFPSCKEVGNNWVLFIVYHLIVQVWPSAGRGKLLCSLLWWYLYFWLEAGNWSVLQKANTPSTTKSCTGCAESVPWSITPVVSTVFWLHTCINKKKKIEHVSLVYICTYKLYTCTTILILCIVQNKN